MNTLLRDIPESAIRKLDEQARGKHMSRNRYLTRRLSLIAQSPELFSKEDKYEKLLNAMMEEIREYRNVLEDLKARSNSYNRGYRTVSNGRFDLCDICQGLLCADCLCECLGGDLIRCC